MFDFRLIEKLECIKEISSDWVRLLKKSTCYQTFLNPVWYLEVCKRLDFKPRIICVSQGGQLLGILPLVLVYKGAESRREYRDAENFWGIPLEIITDAFDLIVEEDRVDIAEALLDFMLKHLPPDIKCHLSGVRADSNIILAMNNLKIKGLLKKYEIREFSTAPVVDIEHGFEAYLMVQSAHFRHQTRRHFRKNNSAGLTMESLSPSSPETEKALEVFLQGNLRRIGDNTIFKSDQVRSFIMQVFPLLIKDNFLRIQVLRAPDNAILGVSIEALAAKSRVMWWAHSYLEQSEKYGPGQYMCLKCIEAAATQNYMEYDLGRVSTEMKSRIQTSETSTFIINLEPISQSL